MIDPFALALIIAFVACLPTRQTPVRFVSITAFQSSSLCSRNQPPRDMPELLITISQGRPSCAWIEANASATLASWVTSISTATAWPPFAWMSAATASSLSLRRAAITTVAPAPASTCAKCSPRPLEAPVTNAVLLARLNKLMPQTSKITVAQRKV